MKMTKINIQLFAEEQEIKTVDDLEKENKTEEKTENTEQPKLNEKDEKIKSLEETIEKLKQDKEKLLAANNDLYAKCLSYKENKGNSETSKVDELIKMI